MELTEKLFLLGRIRTGFGKGFDKRFCSNVSAMMPDALSEKQVEWVDRLLYRYRRQYTSDKNLIKAPEKTFIVILNEKMRLK